MTSPILSVIIASYNHEAFIGATLASLEQQTFQDFEIILIDDGSTDKTVEAARNAKSRACIFEQPNRGVVAARNRGVALAKGKYLCFVDSDDVLLPDRFEKQVNLLESDPSLGMVFSDVLIIDTAGKTLGKFSDVYPVIVGDVAENLLLHYCFVPMLSVMVRADVLRQTGPFEGPGPLSDYIKWIEVAHRNNVRYESILIGSWRRHERNVSKTVDKTRSYRQIRMIIRRLLWRSPDLKAKLGRRIRRRFSKTYFLSGFFLAAAGNVPEARRYYRKAVKVYPWSAVNWAAVVFNCLLTKGLVIKIHQIIRAKKLPW